MLTHFTESYAKSAFPKKRHQEIINLPLIEFHLGQPLGLQLISKSLVYAGVISVLRYEGPYDRKLSALLQQIT